ncbi:MAG TPA: diguanylate cyclase, partial [Candidatus Limnocylindrales bacterium]
DEFVLFLPGLAEPEAAMRRAQEVVAAVAQPISTTAGTIVVGVSVGVVVLTGWGGVPAMGTILRHADTAMFLAKKAGGGAHLFDPSEPGPFEDGWVDSKR